jgi:aspartyl-tRNA(Asn)/glutamyl-tRNA(Gln) amidotransferase subunit A
VPDYEAALGKPIKGMKIGVPTSYFYDGIADDMNTAVRASLDVLRAQGAEIVEVALPDIEAINALGVLVTQVEAATYHATWLRTRPQDYSDQVRARLEGGLAVPGVQYLEALRSRGPVLKNFVEMVFSKVDVLHCPSVNAAAPTIASTDFGGNPAMGKAFAQFTRCARPFNYLGLPTLSLPCGFGTSGLPLGFQLVARPLMEETLFSVGAAYQAATDFHTQVPAG